ncbi:hypothetical protein M9H77_31176 [Catharanthus roseus]|uniref:Uncharacterized protein n=1 Tax=Catharanthus roseus TaxID=4058 RepID=A0ACC0A064_CATRO|nr:hypothetical protein M9H77_31176 [Catharanthus roseus]
MNFTKNFRDCHCSADRLEVIVTVSTESLEEVASPSIWDAVATQVKWAEPREFCCWFPRPPPRLPVRPPCHCHALYCFWLISIFPTTTQGILPLENNFYFMYFPIADAVNKRIFVNTAAAISVGDERCAAVNICSLLLIHVLQFFFLHHFGFLVHNPFSARNLYNNSSHMSFTILVLVFEDRNDSSIIFKIHEPIKVLIFFHRLYFGSSSSGCGTGSLRNPNLFLDSSAISIVSAYPSKFSSFNWMRLINVPRPSLSAR